MSSLNRASLIGNVGQKPEIRATSDGRSIATFSLATSERWKDRNSGEQKERTEWHRVVVFNEHLVPIVERYFDKGKKLFVEGQLRTRKWTDITGVERYTTEIVLAQFGGQIVLLGDGGAGGGGRPTAASPDDYGGPSSGARHDNPGAAGSGSSRRDELDDEIPF